MGIIAKNDLDFFNLYTDQNPKTKDDNLKKCVAAINAFMMKPKKEIQKQIQAVAVSSDFPQPGRNNYNVTIESDNFDMGWEKAFKQVTLGKQKNSWQIYDVSNNLTFQKVEEGHKIEVAGMAGAIATAYVDKYGGAIGWTDELIRFNEVAAMVDKAQIFRNKFWSNKANIHYALLAAAAALNVVAWQGAATDSQTVRDILTINKAAFDLGNGLKDKGYGDMATAPLIIYANPFDEQRIEAAFRSVTANLNAGTSKGDQVTKRRIDRIYTYNSSIVAGSPILILPGQKIQKADAMQPTTYTAEIDVLSLNRLQAVWAYYGGVIGDTDQCYTITLG